MKNLISVLLHIACLGTLTRAQAPIETCNVPYKTMSADEIKATLTNVFQGKVDRGIKDANIMIEKYIPLIEHDVQFVRVSLIHFCHSSCHYLTCATRSGSYFLTTKQLLNNLQHISSGL